MENDVIERLKKELKITQMRVDRTGNEEGLRFDISGYTFFTVIMPKRVA